MRALACSCAALWAVAQSNAAAPTQVLSLNLPQELPPAKEVCGLVACHPDQELDLRSYRHLIQTSTDAKAVIKHYWNARRRFLGPDSTGIDDGGGGGGGAVEQFQEPRKSIEEMAAVVLDVCMAALASGMECGENRYALQRLFLKMQYARLPLTKFQCRRLLLQCRGIGGDGGGGGGGGSSGTNDHVLVRAFYAFMHRRRMLTTPLCNHGIRVLGEHGKWWAALEIFETMAAAGCHPSAATRKLLRQQFSFLLAAAKRKKNSWKWSLMLLAKMEDKGLDPGREAWHLTMVACARSGRSKETLEVFERMIRAGHAPNPRSFSSLLSSIEKEGMSVSPEAIRDMERVLASMRKSGVRPVESIYTTLIAAHGKSGAAAAIPEILEEMAEQKVAVGLPSYNAILTACARVGDAAGAVEWMRRLEAAGLEPNSISYNKLVEALAAGNRWREAIAAYVFMVESQRRLEPSPWAYDALARVCRANSIPIDHRVIGWRPRQLVPDRRIMGV